VVEDEVLVTEDYKADGSIEQKIREAENTLNNSLTNSLTTCLSTHGTADLTTQATTSVLLNTTPTATTLATTLLHLSTTLSTLQNQLTATASLHSSLLSHHSTLTTELSTLQSPHFKNEKNLPQRTAEISRQTKLLKAKVAEYDERLRNASSGAEVPEKLLTEVEAANANAEVLMQKVKGVEARIEVYEGVPPEAREVRQVMVELREELEGWVRRRDGLFEGLVGGGR
jgi:HAUS augmin-like complex subunit 1